MKRMETYTSSMFVHVRFYIYEPKVIIRIKGVVQIHHGLAEHADRYDHFASYLSHQGFVVVVSDFVGHGKSLIDFEQGYFGEHDGPMHLIKDMHHLQHVIRQRYPDVPYFMLGSDLGAVLIAKYVSEYPDYVDGILLLGMLTHVDYNYIKSKYLSIMKRLKGPTYKAHRYFRAFHLYNNKKLLHPGEDLEWWSSSEEERKQYQNDPMTHFSYTVQGYKDILEMIQDVNSHECIMKMAPYLAVYVGVGEYDPMGKEIQTLIDKYKKANIEDVSLHRFKERRHALLFEKDKKEIYLDILNWLNERTYL